MLFFIFFSFSEVPHDSERVHCIFILSPSQNMNSTGILWCLKGFICHKCSQHVPNLSLHVFIVGVQFMGCMGAKMTNWPRQVKYGIHIQPMIFQYYIIVELTATTLHRSILILCETWFHYINIGKSIRHPPHLN